jgi:peptidyl-dipeptidase A
MQPSRPLRPALSLLCLAALAAAVALPACSQKAVAPAETPAAFVARLNTEMGKLADEVERASWVQATYITTDTQALSAAASERYLAYFSTAVAQAKQYDGQPMDADTARALRLLKLGVSAPAPNDPAKRAELARLAAGLGAAFGQAKACHDVAGKPVCRNIDEVSEVIAKSRDYNALTTAWQEWHDTAKPTRADYTRFVELANEGARELGYADLGAMWRSGYDMPPDDFAKEVNRLWGQVKPLYDEMHCYARSQLAKKYGADKVPAGKPIPAQLLGNVWAQEWGKIYGDILQPYPGVASPNADAGLKAQGWGAERMTRSAEDFYQSLGLQALPDTFWQRSMLTRPRDRDVVCHASAWTLDHKDDVRIKTCLYPNEGDLRTVYHELGHVYYFLAYREQPWLFQGGAHDGFHEAIGDTMVLSMTPAFLASKGLVPTTPPSKEAVLNAQMKMAAQKIAFLPFGLLIDQWRWGVFSGAIKPADYNKAWWQLREHYQGVAAPVPRDESDFDAGAKYHVPANTPYTRYFLSYVIQFQFHKALCEAAGFKGPLYECSVYGNKEAGKRFEAMLAAGQSRPWPETLEKLTGHREMDASAIIEYFEPLMGWLKEKNKGQQCGWEPQG